MKDFEKTLLRTDSQPSIGPVLLGVSYTPEGGPSANVPLPTVQHTSADPQAVWLLTSLLREVQGLRQDLADRTLTARCRRAWRWLVARLRG